MQGASGDARERLDVLLVERGLAETRTRARALILAGRVHSGDERLDKPGLRVARDRALSVAPGARWVGRGAEKLGPALEAFRIDVRGRDALDVGASTGGFTQVLLEVGARRVVALDVGRGQLDWSLRTDPRVQALEGVNARRLRPSELPFLPSLAVVDVSFISLKLVLPPVVGCLAPGGEVAALVKPQFEVGRQHVGRGGIVRDPALHRRVLIDLAGQAGESRWGLRDLCRAALRGAEGNQEYFVHLVPGTAALSDDELARRLARETADDAEPAP